MPWRSNVQFVGQPYCFGGKSLYWGGWCPRLLKDDLEEWPPTVARYLIENYSELEEETGVEPKPRKKKFIKEKKFIKGPLFDLLYSKIEKVISSSAVANLDLPVEEPPLAVQGQSPASGVFGFDKYSSAFLLADAAREAAKAPDSQRGLFVVPKTHVIRLLTGGGTVTGIQASGNGEPKFLPIIPTCSPVLSLTTLESTPPPFASLPTPLTP